MPATPADRIAHLRATLARHDELYYKKTKPEISDFEYDLLKQELATLERAHPALAGPSPTQTIGDDRTEGFAPARHRAPMLSLDNTYSQEELRDFDARLRRVLVEKKFAPADRALAYVIEPKVDGLAVCLTYEKGKFTRAVTRGNGVEGDDISANVRTVRGRRSLWSPYTLRCHSSSGHRSDREPCDGEYAAVYNVPHVLSSIDRCNGARRNSNLRSAAPAPGTLVKASMYCSRSTVLQYSACSGHSV